MKKVISMIALAAICIGTVSAATIKLTQDTAKVKTKVKPHKAKVKAKTPTGKVKTKIKEPTT